MDKPQWFELRNLPDEVEAGDRDAIGQWLAKWSRERKVEAMVWIDLKEIPVKVRAGTSLEEEQVSVPDELPRRFNDPDEQLEIWHNHPEAGGPSTAVPGPFADWRHAAGAGRRHDGKEAGGTGAKAQEDGK